MKRQTNNLFETKKQTGLLPDLRKPAELLLFLVVCTMLSICLSGCSGETKSRAQEISKEIFAPSKISSAKDLNLQSDDGEEYSFTYGDKEFYAIFDKDTWTVYNSYRINNIKDIAIICKALSDEHPVPSRDRKSFRTPEDMALEWEQHNLAYHELPDDNHWKESSKNVDLDPDDQGKSIKEIYEERTGKELDMDSLIEHSDKIMEKAKEKLKEKDIDSSDLDLEKVKEKLKEKIKEWTE